MNHSIQRWLQIILFSHHHRCRRQSRRKASLMPFLSAATKAVCISVRILFNSNELYEKEGKANVTSLFMSLKNSCRNFTAQFTLFYHLSSSSSFTFKWKSVFAAMSGWMTVLLQIVGCLYLVHWLGQWFCFTAMSIGMWIIFFYTYQNFGIFLWSVFCVYFSLYILLLIQI